MTKDIIKQFEDIRDLPYEIGPLYEGDNLIEYGKGGCGPKNRYLANYFYKHGYRILVCRTPYSWKELDFLPTELKNHPLAQRVGNHVYIKVMINNNWVLIDASWDKSLYPIFPVNIDWDGKSNQIPATPISQEICMDYKEYIAWRDSNKKQMIVTAQEKEFAQLMNNWFESIRNKNK